MTPGRLHVPRPRAGFGAPFVVVMSVCVLLSLWAIAMDVRSQGAAIQSRKAQGNELCEAFARMAIEEAVHQIRRRSWQDGDPVFELFRAPAQGGSLDLAPADLPHVSADLAPYSGYAIGPVRLEILRRAPMSLLADELVAYDAFGVLRLTVEAWGPQKVASRQVAEYGFRCVLASPPRPFDLFTLFVLNPLPLLTEGHFQASANLTLEAFVESLSRTRQGLAKVADELEEAARKIDEKLDSLGPLSIGADDAKRARDEMRRLATEYRAATRPPKWPADPDWELTGPDGATTGLPGKLHRFAWPVVVYSLADEVDLDRLNLPRRIRPLVQEVETRRPRIEETRNRLESRLRAEDLGGSVRAAEEYLELLVQNAADQHAGLVAMKEFQDDLIEIWGPQAEELAKRFRRLGVEEQARRAPYVFRGQGAADRARQFLAPTGANPPSGVVFVDDPDAPLEIDLPGFAGNLLVVTAGAMSVQNVTVQDPTRDSVALLAHGRLSVARGGIQAGLFARSQDFRGPGESFAGSLVMDTPETAALERTFTGKIQRMPGLVSGPEGFPVRPDPEKTRLTITLSPGPEYRRAER